jgi:hypothetical protein
MEQLTPRSIARPLDQIQAWRLPEDVDLPLLHSGVVQTLGALDALCQLQLPLEVRALGPVNDPASTDCEMIRSLLLGAERTLDSLPHRLRIDQLRRVSPGQALQVERLRGQALRHVQGLRRRVDFIRGQVADASAEPAYRIEEETRPLQATLQ